MHTARLRRSDALARAVAQVLALPLRDDLQQVRAGAARRRRGVDGLLEYDEGGAGLLDLVDELDPVGERAREPVEVLDDQRVDALLVDQSEDLGEPGAPKVRARLHLAELEQLGGRPARSREVAEPLELRREVLGLRRRRHAGVQGDAHSVILGAARGLLKLVLPSPEGRVASRRGGLFA